MIANQTGSMRVVLFLLLAAVAASGYYYFSLSEENRKEAVEQAVSEVQGLVEPSDDLDVGELEEMPIDPMPVVVEEKKKSSLFSWFDEKDDVQEDRDKHAVTKISADLDSMMFVTSDDLSEGGQYPAQLSCYRQNRAPAVAWHDVTDGTKSFVLSLEERGISEGSRREPFVLWLLYDVPAEMRSLVANLPVQDEFSNGMKHAISDNRTPGYGGPCQSAGQYEYILTVHALDNRLGLPAGATRADVAQAMRGHIISQADLKTSQSYD